MSVLHLQVFDRYEYYEDNLVSEEVFSKDNDNIHFYVCNLNECPEDAIICRDLFNATDYINTLKLGMKLAQKGYTEIEVEVTDEQI